MVLFYKNPKKMNVLGLEGGECILCVQFYLKNDKNSYMSYENWGFFHKISDIDPIFEKLIVVRDTKSLFLD